MAVSSQLPGIFQSAFVSSLSQAAAKSQSAMNPTQLGVVPPGISAGALPSAATGVAGTAPTSPYGSVGSSAVSGIGSFIQQIQQTAAMRKAGLLPSTQGSSAAGGQQSMASLLMAMMAMLQQAMGGSQAQQGAQANPFTSSLGQATTTAAGAAALPTTGAAPAGVAPNALASLGAPAAIPGAQPGGVFGRVGDNFAAIDQSINTAIGGIMAQLPLVKL